MRIPYPRALVLRLALRSASCTAIWWFLANAPAACAQQQPDMQAMAARVDTLQRQLEATQRELEEYRGALKSLRDQVDALSQSGASSTIQPAATQPPNAEPAASTLRQAVNDLRDEQTLQQSEIAVHDQAKVETRSRYNLKLGGLILFNGFENLGSVDSIDVPVIAIARPAGESHGSAGASLRQSLITLDATGPRFWGAHSYANVQLDFFGDLSTSDYTSTAGTVRMRSATVQTEWPGWRLHGGLERLLIAQSSPTSYATVGEPAMAWSGNLWAWVPQFGAEKYWNTTDSQRFSLSAALADIPDPGPSSSQYLRTTSAGERSKYPGAEGRTAYEWGKDHQSGFGFGGYFSPHNYGTGGTVDAWASTLDWNFTLPAKLTISGEAYKGQALGGLGGGAFKDIADAYDYEQVATPSYKASGLRDAGGWAQLKFRPSPLLEFNAAFGQDNDTAAQLRAAYQSLSNPYSGLARNQTVLGNAIFRPRASFLLSLEYRKLRSWQLTSSANEAQIIGLAAGYEF